MIDLAIDKIIEGIEFEMGKDSAYYDDNFIESVTNKSLSMKSPTKSISVLEGDSEPTQYNISSRISHTEERYYLQIQTLTRAAEETEAKMLRRELTYRIKHALMRRGGFIMSGVLGLTTQGEGYREVVKKYQIVRTMYDHDIVEGEWLYMSAIDISIDSDVDYY